MRGISPKGRRAAVLLLLAAAPSAHALYIRGYTASRHDRFTGFPTAPVLNTASWITGSNYTGVGWLASDSRRQFALVSPQHFVMPTHWGVINGDQVQFLSSSGQIVTATIASTTMIQESSVGTDLTLGRFTTPIPAGSGVSPFPYGDTNEAYYQMGSSSRRALRVFGFSGRVGGGSISLSQFPDVNLGNGTVSRMYGFTYTLAAGGQDDCYFEDGDSGSPSFIDPSGSKPLLIGTHSAADRTSSALTYTSYDTFLPHYISQLNQQMVTDGYQMIPSSPPTVTLASAKTSTSPTTLRRVQSGTATFTISNTTSSNGATNVVTSLTFPTGSGPTTITGTGWFVDTAGPDAWTLHRATLANGTPALLTASWNSIPATATLPVTVTTKSDGSSLQTSNYDLAPAVSYAEWSAPLAQPATSDDPDSDGRNNLIEYAFGGDPSGGSTALATGVSVDAILTTTGGTSTLRFPVRSDSQVRGLTYMIEWSDNLTSWSTTAPSGASSPSYQAYSPAISGFKESRVTFPANAARKFARVRVTLDENTAGMTVP
ncbi:MAG: hypothetical protein QM755_00885 [Luteolibacter sp.]